MEHFIDKYIPIRIQKLIGESIGAIGSASQLQRFQNFEMEKYKKLNVEVLEDEDNSDLRALMEKVADDLEKTVLEFKAIAKSKGIRY